MSRAPDTEPTAAGAPSEVDSLQRGLEILRAFRSGEKSLRLADIAARTKIPRATAQKLLNTLVAHKFLRYLPELDRYEPDVVCFVLGHALRTSMPLLRVARPVMQRLAEKLGVHVVLAMRERLDMLILERCSAGDAPIDAGVGSLVPLARTALGRAWLWAQRPVVQGGFIERIRAQADPGALDAIPGIYRAFQDLSERGYCMALGDWVEDRQAVATPLILGGGREVYALSAMAADRLPRETFLREVAAPALVDAAMRIKAELTRSESQ